VLMYTDEVVVTSETWEGGVIVTFAKPTSNMHHRIKHLYATVNFNGIPVLPFIVCNEVDMNILPYSMINTYGREEGIKHIFFIYMSLYHILLGWFLRLLKSSLLDPLQHMHTFFTLSDSGVLVVRWNY
jgi:hypothetical protein